MMCLNKLFNINNNNIHTHTIIPPHTHTHPHTLTHTYTIVHLLPAQVWLLLSLATVFTCGVLSCVFQAESCLFRSPQGHGDLSPQGHGDRYSGCAEAVSKIWWYLFGALFQQGDLIYYLLITS